MDSIHHDPPSLRLPLPPSLLTPAPPVPPAPKRVSWGAMPPLLDNVAIFRYFIPILHILLGVINNILSDFQKEMEVLLHTIGNERATKHFKEWKLAEMAFETVNENLKEWAGLKVLAMQKKDNNKLKSTRSPKHPD